MLLSIVIPVFNEKNTLLEIIKKIDNLPSNLKREIILVDDGSTDGSRDILKNLESRSDVKVIFKEKNTGKGDSLKVGFKNSRGDYVIVQDADLEYDPQDYIKLLKEIEGKEDTVIYGSRFTGNYKDMSALHYYGNKFLTLFTNLLYGVWLTDMETCYKLFPGDFIRKLELKANRFDFEPEITAKIIKNKYKIIEVPINYFGRTHFEGKKITWKDGFNAIWSLIKYRLYD
jgi:glycosyltransferase involved in cell wall biosynthesis